MYCYCFAQQVRTTVQVEASRWRSFLVAAGATARTSSSLLRRCSCPECNSTCKQFTSSMLSKRMLKSNSMLFTNWLSGPLAGLPQYVSSVRLQPFPMPTKPMQCRLLKLYVTNFFYGPRHSQPSRECIRAFRNRFERRFKVK